MHRPSAVAGQFYPAQADELRRQIGRCLRSEASAAPAVAAVGPHAGLVYSGAILGETYAQIQIPPTVVLLCPNHTGMGLPRALYPKGSWALPGGSLEIDEALSAALLEQTSLRADTLAHQREHAIEVHLPFLAQARPGVRIVPICLARLTLEQCRALSDEIADVLAPRDDVLVIASTDMTHFLPAEAALRADERALECITALDPAALHRRVEAEAISMCGYVPTTVALMVALRGGASSAEVVRYGHSGEVTGDLSSVVGYAGVVIR